MMFPLLRELAVQEDPIRVPVTVTCRVLDLCRQQYYRWLKDPVTERELAEAYRADALFDDPPRRPGVRVPAARRRSRQRG